MDLPFSAKPLLPDPFLTASPSPPPPGRPSRSSVASKPRRYFVNTDDTVTQKIVVHKTSARGTHFQRAGPRQRVYFQSDEVCVAIVTCVGLCPGLNTVIRELVCGLYDMYGVTSVVGIEDARPRTVLVENPRTQNDKGKLVNNVAVDVTSWKR